MQRARAAIGLLIATLSACVAAAPAGAWGGGGAEHSLRSPVTDESFYFVMADRFENGDASNDHGGLPPGTGEGQSGFDPTQRGFYNGGDLKGLLDRIDYIRRLGTTSIWLTPSFKNKAVQPEDRSAGYHGYWITDFTQIDPHLGTNEDLRALVDAAHRRGMKVYFDIITNHTADVIGYEGGARRGYVSKDREPYRDAAGIAFDDSEFAGSPAFPPLDPVASFPYTPVLDPAEVDLKVPDWLNEVTLYHNRGDTTFVGEDALYGDFFGLDDLFTEHPTVVDGFIDVYETWIRDFGVDGFRIDTMKHVNDEFWQEFGPEVLDFARRQGKREFFMFGEVFDTTKSFTSHFTTTDRMQAVLDFPFQAAAQGFAANSRPADQLRTFFEDDDWYTDADSNVYQLPTFLGNHDMGRIGHFVAAGNQGASDSELLARDRLAHELMYFSRGNPVVYYGDEQGFTGSGGDQVARQTMFASRVPDYLDDDLIGTSRTHAQDNFEPGHPLYRSIADLARLTRRHDALRDGAQQHRFAAAGSGVYAFSRIDRRDQREYVVAVNNAETAQSATIPTYTEKDRFKRLYGSGPRSLKSDSGGRLALTVPALSAIVYKLAGRIPRSRSAPSIELRQPAPATQSRGRMEVRADIGGDSFYEVTFQADTGRGWKSIGTDDNAPYRVFHDVSALRPGTDIRYRAIVLDNRGHARTSAVREVDAPAAAISLTASRVAKVVTARATVQPDNPLHTVRFERSVAGGDFAPIGTDSSAPSPYQATDDITSQPPGTELRYRATLTDGRGGGTVTSNVVTLLAPQPPDPTVRTATIHYNRPDGQYGNWGLHLFGDALAPGQDTPFWDNPAEFEGTDGYGAVITLDIDEPLKQVGFIVHGQPPNENTKDTDPDRFFTPAESPEIWLRQGDTTIYESEPPK
jgi:glycosidase